MSILPEILEKEIVENVEEIKEEIKDLKSDMPDIIEAELSDEDILPVEEVKQKVQHEDVFKSMEQMEVAPPVMVKKVKQKRKMSEEGLKKLALARVKAVETRKRNALLRKEGKMKTKKQVKEELIEKDIEDKRPVVNHIVNETKNITNNITKEDIEKIALETSSKATAKVLQEYEIVRKTRKEEKRKLKEKQNEKVKIHNTIMKAQGKTIGSDGFFDNCF